MTRHFDFRLMRRGMKPRDLERIVLPKDMKEFLGELSVDVFTAASNAGLTFQEALLAVYLSGMENACAASAEQKR